MRPLEFLDESAILAIPVSEPERLFGPDSATIAADFRALAKRWHPDHNKTPEAVRAFERIVALRDAAVERAATGDWRTPGRVVFAADDGPIYELRYRRRHEFELGEIYVGSTCLAYALKREADDLVDMSERAIARLSFTSPEMRRVFAPRLPNVAKSFATRDRRISVLRKTPDQILLKDLLAHCGGRLDPKHVAWIVSDLESLACYLELPHVGLAHPAIGPDTLLVSPKTHSVTLAGGWPYVAPLGEKLVALPARVMNHVPRVLLEAGVASVRLTLETIRLTACEALGFPNATVARTPAVPPPLRKWLLDPPTETAIDDFRSWGAARDASFGPRRFINLEIDPEAVYPPL